MCNMPTGLTLQKILPRQMTTADLMTALCHKREVPFQRLLHLEPIMENHVINLHVRYIECDGHSLPYVRIARMCKRPTGADYQLIIFIAHPSTRRSCCLRKAVILVVVSPRTTNSYSTNGRIKLITDI
jgi:hypothetical protein